MGITFNASTLLNGSGIDVASVVSQIQAESSGELQLWQQQQSTLQTQASDLTSINNDLNSLATAVNSLTDVTGPLSAVAATSSWPAIVTATADTTATSAIHTIVVSTLASSGTVYTDALPSATASILPSGAASGDIQLQVGGSSGSTYDIPITQSNDNETISSLASYINQQSTANNWGVTASVLTDASGARLSITSTATGTTGALAITANTTSDANGNIIANTPTALNFESPVGGTNATFTVDGVPFSSTTNTVTGAIPGVTLSLVSADSATPVQLTVGPDTTQATQAINTFVSAYNTVIGDINSQIAINATTGQPGPLGSDSSLNILQSSLLNDITYAVSGTNGPVNLAAFGINMNSDGTLTVGTTASGQTLAQVLASNSAGVQSFFQTGASGSFGSNFSADLTNLTDPVSGVLNVDLAQNTSEQTSLSSQISNFQTQLATQQQQLTQQFDQVNATLEEYPYLLQAVNEELGSTTSLSTTSSSTGTTGISSTTGL